MRATDAVHLGLMLLALGLAYLVPFELLVLAYVVLGPAHYATEISWLHDRRYFLRHGAVAPALAAIAIGAAFIDDAAWFGFAVWGALVVAALATLSSDAQRFAVLILATGLTAVMALNAPSLAVLGILLPTVIHVSLFTLAFMTLGAWRSGSAAQAALVGVYLAAIALILALPPNAATAIPGFAAVAHDYFGNVAPALSRLFGIRGLALDGRLTGLLAFLYTYHYLNWFIKAEVIRWADIPPRRWALIAALSAASTALYFYDYALGFSVLLGFALLHVVLEFPLDAVALRQLGGALGTAAWARRPARAAPRAPKGRGRDGRR